MNHKFYAACAVAVVLTAAPGLALAQNTVQRDLNVQKRQNATTQGAVAAQKEQAGDVREDTSALKVQREKCEDAAGVARAGCERQVQVDKAEKRSDVTAFKADKTVHQQDAAALKADHEKTKADKGL